MKALNLKGVYFQQEFKRFYPNTQLAAQVLGYVGTDDNGLGGIERKYNQDLHGVAGRMLTAIDARRHVLDSQEREPDPGENLVLTIDENIQFMAERALDSALERTHASNGTIVVQDPFFLCTPPNIFEDAASQEAISSKCNGPMLDEACPPAWGSEDEP